MSDFPCDPDFHQFDGFSLYYSAAAPVVWPEQSFPQVMVLIPWGEMPVKLTVSAQGQTQGFEFAFPEVGIIPPQQLFSFRLLNAQPLMLLRLDPRSLMQGEADSLEGPRWSLAGQYGIRDSVLRFGATVLRDRHLDSSPGTILYCRSLVVFLFIHLMTTYGAKNLPSGNPGRTRVDKRLSLILRYIDENLDQELKVALLAEKAELSSPHFCRVFKKSTGLSPHRYILLQRIDKAKVLLKNSTMSLLDIALQCGFYDQSHFNLQFRNFTGMTPKAYRDTH